MSPINPFPLTWPDGWARTRYPRRSRFRASFTRSRTKIQNSVKLLNGSRLVISSNLPTRSDGLPYANSREPSDTGIAAWWVEKGRQRVMACDRWDKAIDNLHAVALSLEALRGLERWGSSQIVERAFAGFAALPPAGHDWRAVLESPRTLEDAKATYRRLALKFHPDHGGDPNQMARLNEAIAAAEAALS